MKNVICLVLLLLPLITSPAAHSQQDTELNQSPAPKTETERAKARLMEAIKQRDEAKKPKQTSRKISEIMSEQPCACVFNNTNMWNPEKILWKDQYFVCGHYLEDGRCEYVKPMEAATTENNQ